MDKSLKNTSKENKESREKREEIREEIKETGTLWLENDKHHHKIQMITIIGEIEGHEALSGNTKSTKYEHIIPKLAQVEDDEETEGVLILLNTLGGDVEAGLAIAEMIASLSKPSVSLVLGGSHSIGGPLAVSADYSFIVPSGTMIVHPVRSNGMFIGVYQSYRNMERTQDRITSFISKHSNISQARLEELMLDPTQLVKDVGTMLEGTDAVKEGMINEVGGISQALNKLHEMIEEQKKSCYTILSMFNTKGDVSWLQSQPRNERQQPKNQLKNSSRKMLQFATKYVFYAYLLYVFYY